MRGPSRGVRCAGWPASSPTRRSPSCARAANSPRSSTPRSATRRKVTLRLTDSAACSSCCVRLGGGIAYYWDTDRITAIPLAVVFAAAGVACCGASTARRRRRCPSQPRSPSSRRTAPRSPAHEPAAELMTTPTDISERKARLVAQSDLHRMQALRVACRAPHPRAARAGGSEAAPRIRRRGHHRHRDAAFGAGRMRGALRTLSTIATVLRAWRAGAPEVELAHQRVHARLHRLVHRDRPPPLAARLARPLVRGVDAHLAAEPRDRRREVEVVDRRATRRSACRAPDRRAW